MRYGANSWREYGRVAPPKTDDLSTEPIHAFRNHPCTSPDMIPAFALMIGTYIVVRLLDMAVREGAPTSMYAACVIGCLIALGCVAYIFVTARQVGATLGL